MNVNLLLNPATPSPPRVVRTTSAAERSAAGTSRSEGPGLLGHPLVSVNAARRSVSPRREPPETNPGMPPLRAPVPMRGQVHPVLNRTDFSRSAGLPLVMFPAEATGGAPVSPAFAQAQGGNPSLHVRFQPQQLPSMGMMGLPMPWAGCESASRGNDRKRAARGGAEAGSTDTSRPQGAAASAKKPKLDLAKPAWSLGPLQTEHSLLQRLLSDSTALRILEEIPARGYANVDEHLAALHAACYGRKGWTAEILAVVAQAGALHHQLKREIEQYMNTSRPRKINDSHAARSIRAFARLDMSDRWPRLLIAQVGGIGRTVRAAFVDLHAPDSENVTALRLEFDKLVSDDKAVSRPETFRRGLDWHDKLPIDATWHSDQDLSKAATLTTHTTRQLVNTKLNSLPYLAIRQWLETNLPRDSSDGERMDRAVALIVDGTKPDWTLQQVARVVGVDLAKAKEDHGEAVMSAQQARTAMAPASSGDA